MNCHIIIHNSKSPISIRGKWEELKMFLPFFCKSGIPNSLCIKDNTRRIEIFAIPAAPDCAKVGIDLARQYLMSLSKQNPGKTVCIKKNVLHKIIRELGKVAKSV